MTWRARQNAHQPGPDMECSIRPYALPGVSEVGLFTTFGLRSSSQRYGRLAKRETSKKMEVLQKIMGAAQNASPSRA